MAAVAALFTELWQLASAAFAEGCGSLSDVAGLSKEDARQALAYGFQVLTSGLVQVEALARRYATTSECIAGGAKPILADPAFRAAALNCAQALERAVPHLGVPGKRIAAVTRRWIETSNPVDARTLAMACDAAARMTKMKSGRAA